jgi:DNA topoisomerase-2
MDIFIFRSNILIFLLFRFKTDDNKKVEPEFYVPIVPMALINGSAGIGTGWSTNMPNHDIKDTIKNVRRMMRGEEPLGESN